MKIFTAKRILIALTAVVVLGACAPTDDPNYDKRDDYTGNWLCQENSQLGPSSYTVSISKSGSDSSAIFISNFYNLGSGKKAIAIVNGNSLTINAQLVDNLNVAGSGTLSGSQINLSYTVSAGGTDNVTAVYSR